MFVNLICYFIGSVGATVFVGFFAYKVDKLPLTIIVALCLLLMAYSFVDDLRGERAKARILNEHAQR
jgi:hypothetical protein